MAEQKKMGGLNWFARFMAPMVVGALKGVVNQIENPDVENPLSNLLEQAERLLQLLSDDDKDNAAQVKAWAQWHGVETAQNLGFLIVQLLKSKGIEVPPMITDWLRIIDK